MHLNLTQNLKLSQELRLTPMMIQSMEILQLQVMQLQARISQELEENPVLELTEERDDREGEPVTESDADAPAEVVVDESAESFSQLEDLEKSLEPFDSRGKGVKPNSEATEAKHEAMQNTAARDITLQEHLENQLRMIQITDRDRELAEMIVYNIEDDGYLRIAIPDLMMGLEEEIDPAPTEEEVLEVLAFIQTNCEPTGVGARSLEECLLLQARDIPERPPLSEILIQDHIEDLTNNRLPQLAKELDVDIEDIKEVKQFFLLLNPKPGLLFGRARNTRVIPDVIIEEDEEDGDFRVRLENSMIPEIRISSDYRKMIEAKDADAETLGYVKNKVDSARWLIDAIHQRQMTILKISNEIVKIQGEFLKKGLDGLKPLRMQEIADAVGVHVSTVSRAISGKYVQCPQGIFPMKNFFTGGSTNEDGSSETHQAVRNRVKEIIDDEDKAKPYSDDEIVRQLKEQGVTLARRTVAKYRKLMNIPSARLRKEY